MPGDVQKPDEMSRVGPNAAPAPSSGDAVLTGSELYQRVKALQSVFHYVKLISADFLTQLEVSEEGAISAAPYCPEEWEQGDMVRQAVGRKGQVSKLVFWGDELYHIVTRYVEADGRALCLEMAMHAANPINEASMCKKELFEAMSIHNRRMYIDPVTGIYNRRYYHDRYQDVVSACGVAFIDVDDFKQVNDRYGHAMGDRVLHSIAEAISECVRPSDKLIRYAGDEFVIIFEGIPKEIMHTRLSAVCSRVNRLVFADAPDLRVSVSIGGVFGEDKISQLIDQADHLLYQAKKEKNTVFVSV